MSNSPQTPDTKTIYDGHIVKLEVQEGKWEVVRHKSAVAILLQNDAGEMLCVRQYRRAVGDYTVEAPAGLIDDGEEPPEAARRELQEEAGFDADMTLLSRFYSSPGFTDEELFVFRATGPRESRLPMDDDEDIEVLWMQPTELLRELREGRTKGSASTIAAVLHALSAQQGEQ